MKLAVFAIAVWITAASEVTAPPAQPAATPGPGLPQAPTAESLETFLSYISWVFDTALTESQAAQGRDLVGKAYAERREAEVTLVEEAVHAGRDLANYNDNDKRDLRGSVQDEYLKVLRRRLNQELSKWLLSIYQDREKALVRGDPPLTKQQAEAFSELLAFVLNQSGATEPVQADRSWRDGVTRVLTSEHRRFGLEQHAALAGIAADWARLRVTWPTLDEGKRAKLRGEWREVAGSLSNGASAKAVGTNKTRVDLNAKAFRELVKSLLPRAATWTG